MLLPDVFGNRFFDDFMKDPWDEWDKPHFTLQPVKHGAYMSTDVRETETGYELDIELPGYKKEDVKAELKDGYLTISASTTASNDEKDTNGKYIRRERYTGSCSRSFFVGKNVEPEDITAKFEDGILKVGVPKVEQKKIEEKKTISIN